MKKQALLIFLILAPLFAAMTTYCTGKTGAWHTMTEAESLMESNPDSALTLLSLIEKSTLGDKEEQARYALLMSMALDKNYIDTTAFDVLQPAIDYYLKHGSPDERLRTLYYQGRIYQNQGNDDCAMIAFMDALEINNATDSLTIARGLVAQGTLYHKQYKTEEFIKNNLKAADIYASLDWPHLELRSYLKAIDGAVIQNNQSKADSIIAIYSEKIAEYPKEKELILSSNLTYLLAFGTDEEISKFLDRVKNLDFSDEIRLDIARGYSKIGDGKTALTYLNKINTSDSLKYLILKAEALELTENYNEAFYTLKDFNSALETFHHDLFTHNLLFSEDRHKLEITNLLQRQQKDKLILSCLCGVIFLLIISGIIFYHYYKNKTKRQIAEQENTNLKLVQETLKKDMEKLELERKNYELERAKQSWELENLRLEKSQIEGEYINLKELLQEQQELPQQIREVIKERLNMLNSLLAKEISENNSYAKPYKIWIDTIRINRDEFMTSTKLAFKATHPVFMDYLGAHGLTEEEVKYVCLYAIGLRGKEVGEYIQLKRHYNVSSAIRKKLDINEHETNIGPYIRRLMSELG